MFIPTDGLSETNKDIELVMKQVEDCSYEEACQALMKNEDDLVNAIMSLC